MNRRIGFFAGAALVCFLLVPVVAEKFMWVPQTVGGIYVFLTLLAAGDAFGRRKL